MVDDPDECPWSCDCWSSLWNDDGTLVDKENYTDDGLCPECNGTHGLNEHQSLKMEES